MTDDDDVRADMLVLTRLLMAVIGEVALLSEDPLKALHHIRNAARSGPQPLSRRAEATMETVLATCEAALVSIQNQRNASG